MTSADVPTPDAALRCHRCGSTNLLLSEVCHEVGSFTDLVVNRQGEIEALSDGVFEAGDIQPKLTRVHCDSCGHDWHPRRSFTGVRTQR